jgi:heme A synthase
MTDSHRFDTATVMLILALTVVGLLVGIGILRVYLGEAVGSLLRYLAIAVVLLVFSTALYRQWRTELNSETE